MALQSEVSPPMVGDPNTVKQIGETKSEENDIDDNEQSTEEEVDLEDGEIPDSEEEEKDFTHSSLKEALDERCLQDIEKLVNKAKESKIVGSPNHVKMSSPRKINKMSASYMDHDRNESPDHDEGWAGKYKSKYDSKPVDYRDELNEFRGTPPSSPERNRDGKPKRRKSSKKSKKSRSSINRKDIRGMRLKYMKDAAKGKICKFYQEGKCKKGADCMFSHPPPFRKRELCKFYLNGHCNKGKDCTYMHHEFPCKFYHTGNECYAKDKCRFSHAPLTDEMKKVLADYLRMTHGDDRDRDRDRDDDRGRDRKRRMSPEPKPPAPPPKRKCLLGSPPRHIKEAEETKQWQEEMKKLGSQNIPGFDIHLEEEYGNRTPPHFQKPNFYKETLNTPSPQKRQGNSERPNPFHGNSQSDYEDEEESGSKLYVYDDDEFIEITVPPIKKEPPQEYHWKNEQSSGEDYTKPYVAENSRQDCDFASDIKFDETTQFSEMESSVDGPPAVSPDHPNRLQCAPSESRDSDASNQDVVIKVEDPESSQEPPPPKIEVPSHLPRKQRELLMRVLQHQRLNAAEKASSPPPPGENSDFKKEESEEEVVEKATEEESDCKWYSSEDDDDDSDQPLTDVLKKIQQAPPAKPQVQENKAAVNILDMFNKIQQKTMESKGFSKPSPPQKATDFWANILQGTQPKGAKGGPVLPPALNSEPKRRTLLPDPVQSLIKTESPAPNEPAVIKDPRLKSRDPRKHGTSFPLSNPKLSPDRSSAPDSSPSIQDSNPLFSKPLGAVTGEPSKENIPYKLRSISAAPPNYTPYLSASQSNPSLLKDPRLRRHLRTSVDEPSRNGKDHEVAVKPATPKDVPPMPELLRKYTKPTTTINIFESSSSSKRSTGTVSETKPSLPPVKVYDPRMQRRDSRSNSNSSCDTPPHLTIVDPIAMPLLQESKTAPVLESALEDSKAERKRMPPLLEKTWAPVPLKDWKMAALQVEDIKKEPKDAESEEVTEKPLASGLNVGPRAADIKIEPDVTDTKKEPEVTEPKIPSLEKRDFSLGSFPEKSELGDLVIKMEPTSDSESSQDPSKLELASDSSHKKSPSPLLNEEFITVIKEEVTQDSNNDSHPVVPPLIIKKVKPTVASHLPRAIADPRMAKLHTRVEPRRPRVLGSDAKSIVERKKQQPPKADSKTADPVAAVSDEKNSDVPKVVKEDGNTDEVPEKVKEGKQVKEGKGKLSKSIPKKRRLSDKGEEKKKPAHRNRKSSMDYASPLNSCDATNSGKSLDYNNYNQRPKRTVAEKSKIDTTVSKSNSSDTSMPEFALSDSSNLECDNSNDVNLKDRFKTIDPTASPFC